MLKLSLSRALGNQSQKRPTSGLDGALLPSAEAPERYRPFDVRQCGCRSFVVS